ncbi:MAG: hypothetical protein SGPRY_010288, partial [Prymnesium sp.]
MNQKLALEIARLKGRNLALMTKVEALEARISDLQASLRRWKLLSCVLATVLAFSLLGIAYLMMAYAATIVKAAVLTAATVAVASVFLAVACIRGNHFSCHVMATIEMVLHFALQSATWASWWLLQLVSGSFGVWICLFAAAVALIFLTRKKGSTSRRSLTKSSRDAWTLNRRVPIASPDILAAQLRAIITSRLIHESADLRQVVEELFFEYQRNASIASSTSIHESLTESDVSRSLNQGENLTTCCVADEVNAMAKKNCIAGQPKASVSSRRRNCAGAQEQAAKKATHSFAHKHKALYSSERDCARYDAMICRHQDYAANLLTAINSM